MIRQPLKIGDLVSYAVPLKHSYFCDDYDLSAVGVVVEVYCASYNPQFGGDVCDVYWIKDAKIMNLYTSDELRAIIE